MVLTSASEQAKTQNFRYNGGGVAGAVHPEIGKLIGGDALRIERAKTGFVTKKRPAGHGHAARKKRFDGSVQPNDGNSLCAQKFRRALLSVGSTAERENHGLSCFIGAAEYGAQLLGFESTKRGFAKAFKKFRDAKAVCFLDAIIEIDESPGKLTREQSANGCLAGTHESSKTNNGWTRGVPAKHRSLRHDCGANEVNRASGCELYH